MTTKLIKNSLFLLIGSLSSLASAKFLRSAAYYHAPQNQIETYLTTRYLTSEFTQTTMQSQISAYALGMNIEYGLTDKISTGASFSYGSGEKIFSNMSARGFSNSQSVTGFFDPSLFVKSHFQNDSLRFHVNGQFQVKSDVALLSFDKTPSNFAQGGSALALDVGFEGAAGPTTLGASLYGDLWRDVQEVVVQQINKSDVTYFQEGGKKLGFSVFGELSSSGWIKPGLRLGMMQIEATNASMEANDPNLIGASRQFSRDAETLIKTAFYGRVKLPSRLVLNFELEGSQSNLFQSANGNPFNAVALNTQLGLRF